MEDNNIHNDIEFGAKYYKPHRKNNFCYKIIPANITFIVTFNYEMTNCNWSLDFDLLLLDTGTTTPWWNHA